MIAIVNYGSGNVQAIANIYGRLGVACSFVSDPGDLTRAERIILPGVGAFDQAMAELNASGMREALDACAQGGKPILGICVGMQLLAHASEEGHSEGLGWIDGEVKRFDPARIGAGTQIPHMGWNTVAPVGADPLLEGIELDQGYYFLHSYYFSCHDEGDVLARTDYGGPFTSAVHRKNVYSVQFHPEKSHHNGVKLLQNFARL